MAAMINPLLKPVGGTGKEPDKDSASDSNPIATLFHRRVEFHLARKPFSGFSEGGNSGFKLFTLNPNSNSCSKSEPQKAWFGSGKASEHSLEHDSNGLDPELSFTITFRRIGAGLQNLGNTCFLNSVLQCLTYTEPLAAYLQSGRHKISCRMAGFCALCAIQNHVSRALESTGRILAPKDLVSNLRCISRSFRNARQEDAHEYMVNLLESMHKCCLPSGVPSESPSAYEKSLVHKIFGGRLRSQVKCMQCSFCSNKFDPFLDLSLEIVKADSLYKALDHFTAQEQLDGGERQYQCQHCMQKVRALKHLTIYKAPEVLSVHLKRFGSHVPGQKIDKKIQFGPTLDLKPYVTGPYDGDLKYTLYGVLVHAGWSTHSGHYYCFVRTSSGMWYSLDDNRVVQVSEKRVLEQKAYMLFYVRDRTFSASKKTADVVRKESLTLNTSGGEVFFNCNQGLKQNFPNGRAEKKLNDSHSVQAAQKLALNPLVMKEMQMKVETQQDVNGSIAGVNAHQDANGSTVPECSSLLQKHPAENSLKMPPAVGLANGFPILNSNGNCSMQTVPSLRGSDGSVNLLSCINQCVNASNGLSLPAVHRDCDGLQKCASMNESASVIPDIDDIKAGGVEDLSNAAAGPSNLNDLQTCPLDTSATAGPSNLDDLHTCPQDTSVPKENNTEKVGGFSKNISHADTIVQKADGVKDGPSLSPTSKGLLCRRAIDEGFHTTKMKPLKCFVTTQKISKNIIFGAAFARKKKRHRIEHYFSRKSDGDNGQADVGPSTSEESKIGYVGYYKRRMKCDLDLKEKALGKRRVTSDGLQKSCKGVLCRDNIDPCGKSLTGSIELNMSCVALGEKPSDAANSCGSEHNNRKDVENGLISMLTRGLEETTVARWNGVEHSSAFVESRSDDSLRIGYIGDEWDDVYDSGKRKKIRSSKIIFDGANPFQELAMKNAKTNKGKLDRYSSANQPLRI